MSQTSTITSTPTVVVTGANGLVGAATCAALIERGAHVRAVVRRAGTAPALPGVEERVGDFHDPDLAARLVAGADAVVTTVHPMGSDRETQHRIGMEGTSVLARAAAGTGVERFVHVSTAAVYDRSPGVGDVDEEAALVGDDGGDYPVTKRDTDAAIAQVEGLTRVLVRPPAILGAGDSSVWNTLRPRAIRDDEDARRANPDQSFAWVHAPRRPRRHDRRGRHRSHRGRRRPGAGPGRGRLHGGQRGGRAGDGARLPRDGDRGAGRGAAVAGGARVDRPGACRPRTPVGLEAERQPRRRPRRAGSRPAGVGQGR
ncbi:MAG: NAD(P)H-binding protein [Nocardioides marinisabuli]|uniref:NAD-dependent epimerase/dehydratase family protein n=1 Tax=Nocardioides marinisabuli TaxID=419476 RepID=UPI0032191458